MEKEFTIKLSEKEIKKLLFLLILGDHESCFELDSVERKLANLLK